MRSTIAALTLLSCTALGACAGGEREAQAEPPLSTASSLVADSTPSRPAHGPPPADSVVEEVAEQSPQQRGDSTRRPNELGLVPILEYHLLGEKPGQWTVTPEAFRSQLEMLYARGYRPVNLRDVIDRRIDLPRGLSPVVIVFDDASPSQFRYLERPDGTLEIDPSSAVGIWRDFAETHPGWDNRAVFCMLPAAEAGRSFFGDKGIEGQKSEWRFRKVRFLHEQGFELCNHTLWHANLGKYDDAFVQEQIARGQLAIDSVLPGYDVRTFALPLGVWPKNRQLAIRGSWTDAKSGRTVHYQHDAVLLVAGGPARSPYDPEFDPHKLPRYIVFDQELKKLLDRLDREQSRYVSDGDQETLAQPESP